MKSISNQILAYILLSLSVVFAGLYFYRVGSRTQIETDRFEKNSVRTCERLALFYASPIQNHNVNLINEHIDIEALDENIRSIQILDKNNQLFAGVVRKKNKISPITNNQLLILHQDSIVKPVLYQGKVIGKVILYPNKESLEQFVGKLERLFLLELFVFSLAVALILIFILKKVVIN